jgi:hypothetical protein
LNTANDEPPEAHRTPASGALATRKLSAAHAAAPKIWALWRRYRGGSPERKGAALETTGMALRRTETESGEREAGFLVPGTAGGDVSASMAFRMGWAQPSMARIAVIALHDGNLVEFPAPKLWHP